ncbi:MAG: chalcone isomerase family protein [Gammaproteobacteria bacterium]|nr:chalcone isomerase family protein [Gammaproteobacteria bacterium]
MLKNILLILVTTLFVFSVQAREVAGVQIAETATVPGVSQVLQLNGTGIRTKLFFKIYVAALYTAETSNNPDNLLNSTAARRMVMHMLYDEVEKEKLTKGWTEGFDKNMGAADYIAMKPRMMRFNDMFRTLRKNDIVLIDYIPDVGTRVTIAGEEKGVIEGADFFRAVLSVWIGKEPATEDMKEGLLGEGD